MFYETRATRQGFYKEWLKGIKQLIRCIGPTTVFSRRQHRDAGCLEAPAILNRSLQPLLLYCLYSSLFRHLINDIVTLLAVVDVPASSKRM